MKIYIYPIMAKKKTKEEKLKYKTYSVTTQIMWEQ
jgi:hypothetical protein